MAGGYKKISAKDLASLKTDEMFVRAYALAIKTYESQYNGQLGKLVGVSEQIVSGVNIKMTFENSAGE